MVVRLLPSLIFSFFLASFLSNQPSVYTTKIFVSMHLCYGLTLLYVSLTACSPLLSVLTLASIQWLPSLRDLVGQRYKNRTYLIFKSLLFFTPHLKGLNETNQPV